MERLNRMCWRACVFATVATMSVGVVALAWALTGVGVLKEMAFSDLFGKMKAETPVIEESREFLGLMIIVTWMAVLTVRGLRERVGSGPTE